MNNKLKTGSTPKYNVSFSSHFNVTKRDLVTNEEHSATITITPNHCDALFQSQTVIETHYLLKDYFSSSNSNLSDLTNPSPNILTNQTYDYEYELVMNVESTEGKDLCILDHSSNDNNQSKAEQIHQQKLSSLKGGYIGISPSNTNSTNSTMQSNIRLIEYCDPKGIAKIAEISISASSTVAQEEYDLVSFLHYDCINAIEDAQQMFGLEISCPCHAIPG